MVLGALLNTYSVKLLLCGKKVNWALINRIGRIVKDRTKPVSAELKQKEFHVILRGVRSRIR